MSGQIYGAGNLTQKSFHKKGFWGVVDSWWLIMNRLSAFLGVISIIMMLIGVVLGILGLNEGFKAKKRTKNIKWVHDQTKA